MLQNKLLKVFLRTSFIVLNLCKLLTESLKVAQIYFAVIIERHGRASLHQFNHFQSIKQNLTELLIKIDSAAGQLATVQIFLKNVELTGK